MKMIFGNIKSFDYIIEFHDIHLYYEDENDEEIEYLFCINKNLSHLLGKKYLLPINNTHFKNFIRDCLEYNSTIKNKSDFDIEVIQIVEKYSHKYNPEIIKLLNIKLGSLILSNFKYKNLEYLKNLEKYFVPKYNFSSSDIVDNQTYNSQIHFLIIIINNLISISKNRTINLNYQIKSNQCHNINTSQFNYLDFIFDYFTN